MAPAYGPVKHLYGGRAVRAVYSGLMRIERVTMCRLTTRWNGPGMQRPIPAMIRFRESKQAREKTIPGRSARSR